MLTMIRALFYVIVGIMLLPASLYAQDAQPSGVSAQIETMEEAIAPAPAPKVGTITKIQNTVAIQRDNIVFYPQAGTALHLGDALETGAGARALIKLNDETEFTIGEKALIRIDEFFFDDDPKTQNKSKVEIARGAFLWASGLITKDNNHDVKLNTAYGTIGIRGTQVWGGPLDDLFQVFVAEGRVIFRTKRGFISLRKGQGTNVAVVDALPTTAKTWPEAKIARAIETIAFEANANTITTPPPTGEDTPLEIETKPMETDSLLPNTAPSQDMDNQEARDERPATNVMPPATENMPETPEIIENPEESGTPSGF